MNQCFSGISVTGPFERALSTVGSEIYCRTFSVTSRPFSAIRPLISVGSQAAGRRDILTEPKLLARKNKTIEIRGMVQTVGSPSHLKRSPNVALLSLACGRARRPYFGTSVGLAEKLRTDEPEAIEELIVQCTAATLLPEHPQISASLNAHRLSWSQGTSPNPGKVQSKSSRTATKAAQ